MKLELKHLKNYLGTGLKCQYTGVINGKELSAEDKRLSGLDVFDPKYKCEVSPEYGLKIGELKEIKVYKNYWTAHIGIQRRGLKTFCNGHDFKPILLPLSALTEPFTDGSVPIVELAKIATGLTEINTVKLEIKDDGIYLNFNEILVFAFCQKSNSFGMYDFNASIYTVANQLQLFEYLYSNHFWLGDQSLFENGEIIDKRTVK